jgi:hypothetical protein
VEVFTRPEAWVLLVVGVAFAAGAAGAAAFGWVLVSFLFAIYKIIEAFNIGYVSTDCKKRRSGKAWEREFRVGTTT